MNSERVLLGVNLPMAGVNWWSELSIHEGPFKSAKVNKSIQLNKTGKVDYLNCKKGVLCYVVVKVLICLQHHERTTPRILWNEGQCQIRAKKIDYFFLSKYLIEICTKGYRKLQQNCTQNSLKFAKKLPSQSFISIPRLWIFEQNPTS